MADNDLLLKDLNASPVSFYPETKDLGSSVRRPLYGSADGAIISIGARADSAVIDPTVSATLIALIKGLLTTSLKEVAFSPNSVSTSIITATTTAASLVLTGTAISVRVRVDPAAAGTVFFKFGQGSVTSAVVPASGTPGDMGIDPGRNEVFSVPTGTDRVSVISPYGNSDIYFTTGIGK